MPLARDPTPGRVTPEPLGTPPSMKTDPTSSLVLTPQQEDEASGHGDPRLLHLVITPTLGALHPHGGDGHADDPENNGEHHEGAGGLQGSCGKKRRRLESPSIPREQIRLCLSGHIQRNLTTARQPAFYQR